MATLAVIPESGVVIANQNGTLTRLDAATGRVRWTAQPAAGSTSASGSGRLERTLAITGNTVDQDQKVFHLGLDPIASRLVVDANRYHFTGGVFASYDDGTTSPTLADWPARSGQDRLATSY